jgi:hypothetical protein
MNTYKVRGFYTISFEKKVEAESRDEAESMAYDINIEGDGNSIFVNDDTELSADGAIRDVEVELIDGEESEE